MPSEALWKRAAHELQSPLINALGVSPFTTSSYPSAAMIIYAVFFLLLVFGLAVRRFGNRDL